MRSRTALAIAVSASAVVLPGERAARAQAIADPTNLPVAFSADELRLDTRTQALDATGNVRVDEPPFHLSSEYLELRRVPIGVELDGQGKLALAGIARPALIVTIRSAG